MDTNGEHGIRSVKNLWLYTEIDGPNALKLFLFFKRALLQEPFFAEKLFFLKSTSS